ncbi:MAG: histidinol-phosphatase [Oscillospiraceae bacterium]
MKNNFHTHTYRCHHATGTDEEYVKSAIAAKIRVLGFSDHTPWPFKGEYRPSVRMDITQLDSYLYSITSLRERFSNEIDIKVGLECEYFEKFIPWLSDMSEEKKLDYLIFGNHFPTGDLDAEYFGHSAVNKEHMDYYCETALRGMEFNKFAYFAHPDLFMRAYPEFDKVCENVSRKICEKAAKLNLPLEFNISGYQMSKDRNIKCYPHTKFWEIAADCNCSCIIGFDAHKNSALEQTNTWNRALATIHKLSLKRIDSFEFLQ